MIFIILNRTHFLHSRSPFCVRHMNCESRRKSEGNVEKIKKMKGKFSSFFFPLSFFSAVKRCSIFRNKKLLLCFSNMKDNWTLFSECIDFRPKLLVIPQSILLASQEEIPFLVSIKSSSTISPGNFNRLYTTLMSFLCPRGLRKKVERERRKTTISFHDFELNFSIFFFREPLQRRVMVDDSWGEILHSSTSSATARSQ
jgi:hypothetical protein